MGDTFPKIALVIATIETSDSTISALGTLWDKKLQTSSPEP